MRNCIGNPNQLTPRLQIIEMQLKWARIFNQDPVPAQEYVRAPFWSHEFSDVNCSRPTALNFCENPFRRGRKPTPCLSV